MNVFFKGGVTNYEGIAVDHSSKSIFIFEKALFGGRVYSVPLTDLSKARVEVEAMEIGRTSIPFACACDISADSRSMVVITYSLGFLFTRITSPEGIAEDWSETLKQEPKSFLLPKMRQPEAVCFRSMANPYSLQVISYQPPSLK